MKKKIVGITTARSEFGRSRTFYQSLANNPHYEFSLFVGFGHADSKFGDSYKEILDSGIVIGAKTSSIEGSIETKLGQLVVEFSDYLDKVTPDLIIIPGDRYEMLLVALIATTKQIPILHIGGGYVTLGAIDEQIRNAITKLSSIHFVASVGCGERVRNLNEDPSRIYVTGAPELDEIVLSTPIPRDNFLQKLGIAAPFVLATFHPETTISIEENKINSETVENFFDSLNYSILITAPCQDPGFEPFLNLCQRLQNKNPKKYIFRPTLGVEMYLSAMHYCYFMVGNSSSGIIESPTVGVPVLNVGNRQKFREHGINVVHSDFNLDSLLSASDTIKYKFPIDQVKIPYFNPYGEGKFLEKADKILLDLRLPISKINKY
jgi:GDP/UDP-N,N'-diacetylbacillosamine 2-epimerase (hydrolysing)